MISGRAAPAVLGVAAVILAAACSEEPAPDGDAVAPGPTSAGPVFRDVAREAGLDLITRAGNADKRHLLESTGTGVAVADYDGDGDVDLYLATAQTTDDWLAGRRPRANALYRNEGDGTFVDVAVEAGVDLRAWSSGTYFVDYDDDGDRDLFVTAWGPNVLYRNEGDGSFTDVTRETGLAGHDDDWSTSAAFGDLDLDGDLDLYVTNYCVYDLRSPPLGETMALWKGIRVYPGPRGFTGQHDLLYRNDGDGTFTEIGRGAGLLDGRPLFGLGVVFSDLDDDGDPDIFVANDSVANQLWRNDGGLRFTEVAAYANVATNEDAKEQAGMGTDAADYDGDGRIDLVVTNFSHEWNTLHRNAGPMFFVDTTFPAGLRDSWLDLAWGTAFFDYDNDGRLDLVVANGHIYPEVDSHPHLNTSYRQRNRLYRNIGDGRFEDVTASAGPGMQIVEGTRGLAVIDIDADGDLDLALSNIDAAPNLLINEGGDRLPWISVRLAGTRSNRDGIGARLTLTAGGRAQVREINPFGSYQSQGRYRAHFGLGAAERVERLEVRWPSGVVDVVADLAARRHYRVTEGEGVSAAVESGETLP